MTSACVQTLATDDRRRNRADAVGFAACDGAPRNAARQTSQAEFSSLWRDPIGTDCLLAPPSAYGGRSPMLQVAGTAHGVVVAVPCATPRYRVA